MKVLVCVFFMIPVISLSQKVSVDFENNDLTDWFQSIPGHWCISDVNTLSGNNSLIHCYNSEIAGFDWITYFHQPIHINTGTTQWDFTIMYNVNPSSNNNWSVMLNDYCLPDMHGTLRDGIIIGVNYQGHSDEIMVWETHDSNLKCLLNTGFNWEQNISKNESVKLSIRNFQGNFDLLINSDSEKDVYLGSYIPEYSQTLNAFTIFYKYTPSYDRNLWFDDLSIEAEFFKDQIPPSISYSEYINDHSVEVGFSEPVRVGTDESWCIQGIGCGTASCTTASEFELVFPNPMHRGCSYFMELPEISDVYGNNIEVGVNPLEMYFPAAYDIVISEILADPAPPVLLPEVEYIELFNTSSKIICLKDWQFSSNARKIELPNIDMQPYSYLLLYDKDVLVQFDPKVQALGLNNFPVLSNSGSTLILQDRSGKLIHSVAYEDDWYTETIKKDGGWSLEMIDPRNACAGADNWRESMDYRGGTPAEQNSVYSLKTIDPPPSLWRAAVSDSGSLILYFSEPLDSVTLNSVNYFSVNKNIGPPIQIIPSWPLANRVELFFARPFAAITDYTIKLTSDLCDCSGNRIKQPSHAVFSIPAEADSSDIVINEVMFDPETDHIEFIELFNTSRKTIDLNNYCLVLADRCNTGKIMTTDYWPLLPGDYCLVASDYKGIDSPETFEHAEKVLFMPGMPCLSNEGNTLFLFSSLGNIIDAATYSPDWHHAILAENKGVSLERISAFRSGLERTNWQSAASDAGYMTPAALNSQQSIDIDLCEVTIEPETITPNADDLNDEMVIRYRLDLDGYMGRVIIFNIQGKKCRTLANGVLLGTTGYFIFDGKYDSGFVMTTGYYIMYFEAYHQNSQRYVIKKAFVVAH